MSSKHSKTKENKSDVSERKRRSDNDTKNTCFYMYYLLVYLDPTIQITLNRNTKQGSQPNNSIRNFQCSSIISNTHQIFQSQTNYSVMKTDDGFHSLTFDDSTDVPNLPESSDSSDSSDSSESKIFKQTADQSCRTQQHIMLNKINKLLLFNFKASLTSHVRRQKSGTLSKLTLDTFLDIDMKNLLFLRDTKTTRNEYNEICETMNLLLSYFLDNRNGITQQLIIGDSIPKENSQKENECIYLSRYIFHEIFYRIRFGKEKVDDVMEEYANKFGNKLPSLNNKEIQLSLIQKTQNEENGLTNV